MYKRQGFPTEKKEIEEIMDDVRENDQCLFFVGVTIILMAESKKELESVCAVSYTHLVLLSDSRINMYNVLLSLYHIPPPNALLGR